MTSLRIDGGAPAESRNVLIRASFGLAAPDVVRARDAADLAIRQLAVGAVDEMAQLARIDEQRFAASVAVLDVALRARDDPEACWDAGAVEELLRLRDHADDQVGLDDALPNVAFAALARRHGAVRQHEAGDARRRQVAHYEAKKWAEERIIRGFAEYLEGKGVTTQTMAVSTSHCTTCAQATPA